MPPPTYAESLSERFAQHVELLQEFFASRHLSYGAPENVVALADRLSAPGSFRGEMTAMLRTVLYRESLSLTRPELLDLVLLASGGRKAAALAHHPGGAVNQVEILVQHVLRSMMPISSPMPEDAEEEVHGDDILTSTPAPSERDPGVVLDEQSVLPKPRFSAREAAGITATRPSPAKQVGWTHRRTAAPRSLRGASTLRFLPYALGVCVLVLAFSAGWFLHRRTDLQTSASGGAPSFPSGSPLPGEAQDAPGAGEGVPAAQTAGDPERAASAAAKPSPDTPQTDAAAAAAAPSLPPQPTPDTAGVTDSPPPEAASEAAIARSSSPAAGDEAHDVYSIEHSGRRGLLSVSSGVMNANLISAPPPDYPLLARIAHEDGQVVLQVIVSRDGTVLSAHALVGHELLRGAAERAVRLWVYRPYLVHGRAVPVRTIVFVNFRRHHGN